MIGFPYYFQISDWNTFFKSHIMNLSVTMDIYFQTAGQCIDYRCPYTMKSTGYLISAATEFTTRMQYGHDDFNRGTPCFFMHTDVNTASIIYHGNTVILLDNYLDFITISCLSIVNTIVDYFPYKLMESFYTC